jgi:hypothetical protein
MAKHVEAVEAEYIIYVACLLKPRTVEPAKQPLLENGSETTFASKQRPRNREWNCVAKQRILNKHERAAGTRKRILK